jgi:hypothetical protein
VEALVGAQVLVVETLEITMVVVAAAAIIVRKVVLAEAVVVLPLSI